MTRIGPEGRWLCTIMATALLSAGCAWGGGSTARLSQAPPLPRPINGVTQFTADEAVAFHEATEQLIVACMRERQHTYRPAPAVANKRLAAANPYGLLTEEQARTDGYGTVGQAFETSGNRHGAPSDSNRAALEKLTKDERKAWEEDLAGSEDHYTKLTAPSGASLRVPKSGCVRHAHAEFYGEKWDALFFLAQDLANQVLTKTEASGTVRAAVRKWSQCMGAHGYAGLSSLQDPRRRIDEGLKAAGDDKTRWKSLGREDISLARHDYQCERESMMHEAVNRAQRVAERQILTPRWAAAVAELRELKQRAKRKISPSGA
ncbi:hypothetical protein ACQEVG_17685 [Streptomyces sp. CA-135486]|uniref:hypothetical protein n=1 Tax=Streptomyces sp. CA-135486 TaxID=3240049 RepID=UPI003D90ECEF